jgi:hypothetical protein
MVRIALFEASVARAYHLALVDSIMDTLFVRDRNALRGILVPGWL